MSKGKRDCRCDQRRPSLTVLVDCLVDIEEGEHQSYSRDGEKYPARPNYQSHESGDNEDCDGGNGGPPGLGMNAEQRLGVT
jgi:hypothetical protein